jgi:hypothetical protein
VARSAIAAKPAHQRDDMPLKVGDFINGRRPESGARGRAGVDRGDWPGDDEDAQEGEAVGEHDTCLEL